MHNTLYYSVFALAASSVSARAVPGLSPRHAFGTTGQCAPQPLGSGPVTNSPDTADAFVANPVYASYATSASTPAGYSLVYQNFPNATTTGGYLGYEDLTSYDVNYCASQCNSFWPGCTSFNIYFERDPTVDPGVNCTNPPSTTNIKCSFWSQCEKPADATNVGQYCQDFHVVIAGSNAYNVNNGSCASSPSTTTSTTKPATTTTSSTTKAATTTSASSQGYNPWAPVPAKPTPTPIKSCPVAETTYTAKDGSTWAVCKGSDYQGTTTQNVNWIYNNKDCAAACANTSGCTKAVFYADQSVCYIKGSGLTWTSSTVYDSIRQLTGPTPKPTPTPAPSNDNSGWSNWSSTSKTCFLWICW